VGFKFDASFASGDTILTALNPMLKKFTKGDKRLFTVERQDAFGVALNTEDGFLYGIEPAQISVMFRHSMKLRTKSAGLPVAEMLSNPLPFTKMLPVVSHKLIDVSQYLPEIKERKLERVGIVALALVANDEVPPGISRFIKYVGRPWGGALESYVFNIAAEVKKGPSWVEKCTHQVVRPEDKEEPVTLIFDWMRTFSSEKSTAKDSLEEELASATKSALEYFETLAEGNRFDEILLNATA
jgi:hypothetical protein